MTSTPAFLTFWGKARPLPNASVSWHPVAFHLLDVAASAEALLTARPVTLATGARLLGLEPSQAKQLLTAIAVLHDIGKFCPAFQAQSPDHWPATLGVYDVQNAARSRHTDDGFSLWQGHLKTRLLERVWRGDRGHLRWLMQAVFGHHGRPVQTRTTPVASLVNESALTAAETCAIAVLDLVHPEPITAPPLNAERACLASWWVAGFVTIADWVGSHQRWFPYHSHDCGLERYWAIARQRAVDAVHRAGLVAPVPAALQTCASLISVLTDTSRSPTPAQKWAETVVLPPGPLLIILEDVTGSGKTEAAQMLVHRLMVAQRIAGAYWAMPTQATANAMYTRQESAVDAFFADDTNIRPSLVLAHGQARLHERFRASVFGDESYEEAATNDSNAEDDDVLPSSISCAAFLADDRRASLLADIGAGTVDQALLGILPNKFNTVRLFGLADKALVIDEAHAYDAYMEVELAMLLKFQAALGGCAIVLSATLSREQREGLITAWRAGLGVEPAPSVFAVPTTLSLKMDYPLATIVYGDQQELVEQKIDAVPYSVRRVDVRFIHDTSAAVDELLAAAQQGAAVAWVRNTVDSCLQAAALLRERGVPADRLLLFHARFAQGDRQVREQEVLKCFDKDSSPSERRGRILIATQVIEQSLDLDFDVMVSDLAPIDLLVQRAGRLWRHADRDADRPTGLKRELVVLAPQLDDDARSDWLKSLLPGTDAVYQHPGVLWRTLRILTETSCIETPDGLRRLIESVYASRECPPGLESGVDRAEGNEKGDMQTAQYNVLKPHDGYSADAQGWISDLQAATRLIDPQTTVRLARFENDQLIPWTHAEGPPWKAWALSEVRLSSKRVPPDAEAQKIYQAAIRRTRATWGRFEQNIPILPLVLDHGEIWRGTLLLNKGERQVNFKYGVREGLMFE